MEPRRDWISYGKVKSDHATGGIPNKGEDDSQC